MVVFTHRARLVALLVGFGFLMPVQCSLAQKLKPYLTIAGFYEADPGARGPIEFGPTRNDLFHLQKTIPAAKNAITLRTMRRRSVRYADRFADATLVGCTPKLAKLAAIEMVSGRFFRTKEATQADNVCVIGQRLAERLYPSKSPIGHNLRIDRSYCLIVGVAKPPRVEFISVTEATTGKHRLRMPRGLAPATTFGAMVYIPMRTMKARFGDVALLRASGSFQGRNFQLSEIWIPGVDEKAEAGIREFFLQRHSTKTDYRINRRLAY